MSDHSTHLQLPFLAQGQAQKHVTVNESLLRLDAVVQLSALSATVSSQPASPNDGDIYILPGGKSGVQWSAMADGALAYYRDGAWEELSPREGWLAFVCDTDLLHYFDGAAWIATPDLNTANAFSASQSVLANSSVALTLAWADDGANGVGVLTDKNSATPAASDDLFAITVQGRDSAAATAIYGTFSCRIASPTAGAHSGYWSYATRQGGVNTTVARFGAGIYHPSASGGDKGANTINFGAVYDDNTLLTCGPIEFLNTGAIDLKKWDALVPEPVLDGSASAHDSGGFQPRRHKVMHAFAAMIADGFDPRDPENYCARMKRDGAAPGLMTEAEWRDMQARGEKADMGTQATRIFLALDNLAVAFAGAMDRIAALEAKLDAR